jgi:Ca2+-binding EF-hand superfamily protein
LINKLFVIHLQAEAFLHEVKKNLELTDLSNLFDFMDVDNNGFLTLNEVKKILILV